MKKKYLIVLLLILLFVIISSYLLLRVLLIKNDSNTEQLIGNVHFSEKTKIYEINNGTKGNEITDKNRANIIIETDSTTQENDVKIATINLSLKYPGDAILIETVIENYSSQDIVLKGFEVNGVSKGLIVTQPTSAVITPDSDKLLANKGVCTAQFLVKWDPAIEKLETSESQSFTIGFKHSQYEEGEKSITTLTHSEE